ncbi:MAG: hypothetical protein Q9177_001856 [Variospora cf. flavescens]
MDNSQHHYSSKPLAHLKNTTSTPPPASSNITAWVDQLPTPPQASTFSVDALILYAAKYCCQAYILAASSKPLAPTSGNPRRLQPDHDPNAPTANKSLKRRTRSPPPQTQPSKRTAVAASERTRVQRRSARVASLQSKMTQTKGKNRRGGGAVSPPLDNVDVDEEEREVFPMHSMATRAKTGMPPKTPNRSAFDNAPSLPYTTPSGQSGSPGKPAQKSPSKSISKSRNSSPSKSGSADSSSKVIIRKEQLAQMSPSVIFIAIKHIKDESVPEAVTEFWTKYMMSAIYEDEVVPRELRTQLETMYNTPMKTKGPISGWSYSAGLYNASDLSPVLDTVKDVVDQAEQQRGVAHEPSWVADVVTPIMSRLRRLSSSVSTKGRTIEALNISSVSIAPLSLCPKSVVDDFKDANKKVDYALALKLTHEEELTLQSAVTEYLVPGGASINQTQGWTATKPMFEHTEVKVDACDPMIQLAVWICAEIKKRSLEGYNLNLPIPVIAIERDHWSFWIAYWVETPAKDGGKKAYRVKFLGPVPMGSTDSAFGVFKILHVLKAIVRWGFEIYEPEFQKHIYAKYQNK